MLRPWLVVAFLLWVLPGCSSDPELDDPVSPTTAVATSTAPVKPVARTDTLYLLDAPHMAGMLAPDAEPIRTPMPAPGTTTGSAMSPEWRLPVTGLVELQTTLVLYIDTQGVVTAGTGGNVCFWMVGMRLEHADGSSEGLSNYCFGEDPVVPTGIQRLEFAIPQTLVEAAAPGDLLFFDFGALATFAPGATMDILSGTLTTNSSFTVAGLQIPVDTQTYL